MQPAFPFAEVEPGAEHWRVLDDAALPDEDDRHVLAAAIAAEATVLCTSNAKDFTADDPASRVFAGVDPVDRRLQHKNTLAVTMGPELLLPIARERQLVR